MTWIRISDTQVINSDKVTNIKLYHGLIRFDLDHDTYLDFNGRNQEETIHIFSILIDCITDESTYVNLMEYASHPIIQEAHGL